MSDALTLASATERRFYFRCTVCFRRGRYSRATLGERFGKDFSLPEIPRAVAKWRGCKHVETLPLQAGIACGIHFDIAAMYMELKQEVEAHKHSRG